MGVAKPPRETLAASPVRPTKYHVRLPPVSKLCECLCPLEPIMAHFAQSTA